MIEKQIEAKSIITRSKIGGVPYCINPYVGCQHACRYCYARFMKKFTGHTEKWGSFVDIKINAAYAIQNQLKKLKKELIMISTVTDAYQPLEKKYLITRKCLGILLSYQFPISILTKSFLVLRDIDLISKFEDIEVGFSITTDNDYISRLFEPFAPLCSKRIEALKELHMKGIRTYAFIGPILPMNPSKLVERVSPYVNEVLIDRLNYSYLVEDFYKLHSLDYALKDEYFQETEAALRELFSRKGIEVKEANGG